METEIEDILNNNNKVIEGGSSLMPKSNVLHDESYKESVDSLMDYLDDMQRKE